MIIRLILSLGFVALVLLWAARLAKKRGLGQGSGLIEVVARQRLGRTSTVSVVRIDEVVKDVCNKEEQVTKKKEKDPGAVQDALRDRAPVRLAAARVDEDLDDAPTLIARPSSSPALAGSVLDRDGWGNLVHQLRERTVRR